MKKKMKVNNSQETRTRGTVVFKKKKNRTEINVNWQVGSNGGGCADLSNLILYPFY
jgi:hypothetical protein